MSIMSCSMTNYTIAILLFQCFATKRMTSSRFRLSVHCLFMSVVPKLYSITLRLNFASLGKAAGCLGKAAESWGNAWADLGLAPIMYISKIISVLKTKTVENIKKEFFKNILVSFHFYIISISSKSLETNLFIICYFLKDGNFFPIPQHLY